MKDDGLVIGMLAMFGTVAVVVLVAVAYLLQPAHTQAPQFPAVNTDCAVPLVEEADGSLSCPRYKP